ncbi:hypothetical protein DPMN_116666 [Dreissena polymorpha]|uniref:Uncharacterized protein n=1 Tax=Dreissena polymorpha TaxID=45954 RepID=A0A9D4KNF2_DREPO|nr:hypothetical protein DPMN_116666 [Dreissena polymorpha]
MTEKTCENLAGTLGKPITNVSEQFPKDIADRRRSLMPAFRKARADGKRCLSQL